MNPINETHPYKVDVWVKSDPSGIPLFGKAFWLEMARCMSDMRARAVGGGLSIMYPFVRASVLQGDRFVPVLWWPDEVTVKRETESV